MGFLHPCSLPGAVPGVVITAVCSLWEVSLVTGTVCAYRDISAHHMQLSLHGFILLFEEIPKEIPFLPWR